MNYKIAGCCSLCDNPVFEVMAVWEEGTLRVGEPKRLGVANDGATRVSFLLLLGGYTDMTFCVDCAAGLNAEHYTMLWRKNLAGYLRQQDNRTEKFADQFSNALLCEIGRVDLKDVLKDQLILGSI